MSIGSEDRRRLVRKTVATGIVLVVVLGASLCMDLFAGKFVSPATVLWCYGTWFGQLFAAAFNPGDVLTPAQLLEMEPSYYALLTQAATMFLTAGAGMLLALAGTLYQSVFRNPIASPSMLGVSSGVQLGVLILVLLFGTAAGSMGAWRYGLCYGCGIGMLVILFVLSKLMSGRGKPINIVNMLVMGTLLTQLVGVVVTYVGWYVFDDELWEVYNQLSEVLTVNTDWYALLLFAILAVVSVVPIVLLRFRLNLLSFDEDEMKVLGVDATRLQLVALLCATVMMVAAQVSVGTVAMVSLVVPHVSRFLFGAEFRKQLVGNVLLGALLLVACRFILAFVPYIGSILPIGTVVSFVVLPVFVWIIATQQRSWE